MVSKPLPVSPLAPASLPEMPPLDGVTIASAAWSNHYQGRPNLLLMRFDKGTTVAGRFTRSQMPGAPIDWCRKQMAKGKAQALLVNAGNANVFTGKAGAKAVAESAKQVAQAVGCPASQVMIASTGVIGEPLDPAKVCAPVPGMAKALEADGWHKAADAIRTTDTFAKGAVAETQIDGVPVRIMGIAKGSGMIEPDLGTMLSYIVTDAAIPADVLDAMMGQMIDRSFNAITVDTDTSTSDMVLLFATGKAKHQPVISAAGKRLAPFKAALQEVMADLAQQVVRDGEGATKLIEVTVEGAASAKAARLIAKAIANSPLVKTAIAGEDANWGRIVMAIGKSGQKADRDRLSIDIGGMAVARKGLRVPDYDEGPLAAYMKGDHIAIRAHVGVGKGSATVWGCDLTHGYISINADYRS